jgi:methyltransferase (TIGR00027 family)
VKQQQPDETAVVVALWRGAHLSLDPPPHVLEDDIGVRLVEPDASWLSQPLMGEFFRPWRASVVARARLVEDLAYEGLRHGVEQLVILGAGLDSLALRRPDLMTRLRVFEVDAPSTQRWKWDRLNALRLEMPPGLRFIPIDFQSGPSWLDSLVEAGFDPTLPALVAVNGVTQYLTADATQQTMHTVRLLAAGSRLVCGFVTGPTDLAEPDRELVSATAAGAADAGHPWISYFTAEQFLTLAHRAGFYQTRVIDADELSWLYFAGRADGLRPTGGEAILVASW